MIALPPSRECLLFGSLSSVAVFAAWRFPAEPFGALLGFVAALLLCLAVRNVASTRAGPYFHIFIAGVVLNILAFYWLFGTISRFGGFGAAPTAFIFAFFVAVSALQYPVFLFIFRSLPSAVDTFAVRGAVAWVSSEQLSIRIFPWQISHTQLGFSALAQIADIGGTLLISFMLIWISEAFMRVFERKVRSVWLAAPFAAVCACIIYGQQKLQEFSQPPGAPLEVALVQANITLEERSNVAFFAQNAARYVQLTRALQRPNLLVIWPESVIQDWVSVHTRSVRDDPRLPRFEPAINLLTGALTFHSQTEIYNSALAIYADGRIPVPSHKQILMPFGEYTPFSSVFPWLAELNQNVGNFSAGTTIELFEFPLPSREASGSSAKVSALICYEDVIPRLARQATRQGAELLVNLTNDAWFGDSPAAVHHNLIASFRAIENRRYLLRSTNSGLTAIINPRGETISKLKPFSEGTLLASVHLMGYKTLYTQWIGEYPWWVLAFGALLLSIAKSLIRWRMPAEGN